MSDIIQFMENHDLTPRQIVSELDKYIIGQKDAKKCVAIALRNRSRRKKLDPELQEEISPKNIIMIGPTGVGKTEIARRLSKLVNAPFIKVEITKYTEVGYVGRDVESMIRDLIAISVNMVKKEYSTMVEEKALKNAYDKIVDIIIPKKGFEFDDRQVSGFHMERESIFESDTMYEQMRKQYLEDLKNGNLDDMEIEYESEMPNVIPVMSVMGGSGLEDIDMQIQSMLGDLMPKKSKRKKSTVKDALRIFITEETEKLIDMEKVTIEAVKRVEDMGIVFIDEIDKIAGVESKSGPDVSRQGVQRDLLPIIEGTTVNTKYGPIKTNHVLFIAAGAFNVSKPSDLIPELQGRFPIRVELSSLSEEDFRKILTVPKNSLTLQYKELLKTEGVAIEFTRDGIAEIARIAQVLNDENENIGARRLHTIMEKLLEDILFDAPDLDAMNKNFTINAEFVKNKLEATIKNKDLSKYIL
ncbi:MAG: ATP-dependent protease ATPase subunit HslU [Spirochaetes bacterium]|mgnify:CR=1 FL=1|nr:ATP-dependent protease ATPase subunit HslU [Spirochaetota bacterium]HOE20819.1 ATP-dependent protease ATPase subunit HslU [Spirochaetota bacterium]HQL42327.1 ATP-dependent protease ATPase subunit HslU [Spirochaetota bacterium]